MTIFILYLYLIVSIIPPDWMNLCYKTFLYREQTKQGVIYNITDQKIYINPPKPKIVGSGNIQRQTRYPNDDIFTGLIIEFNDLSLEDRHHLTLAIDSKVLVKIKCRNWFIRHESYKSNLEFLEIIER